MGIGVVTTAVPKVSIYSDSSGRPGTNLKVLTNPSGIPSTSQSDFNNDELESTDLDFDASDFRLDPSTSYWLVVERASGDHSHPSQCYQ